MDIETKNYLTDFKEDMEKKWSEFAGHIEKLLNLKVENIKEQQETFKKYHKEHYENTIKIKEDIADYKLSNNENIGKIEGRVKTLEDDKEDGKLTAQLNQAERALEQSQRNFEEQSRSNNLQRVLFITGLIAAPIITYLVTRALG